MIGRFLTGISMAAFALINPLYTGEISTNKIRGTLLSFFQINLNIGTTIIFVIGFFQIMP
jgi:MFS family permease